MGHGQKHTMAACQPQHTADLICSAYDEAIIAECLVYADADGDDDAEVGLRF